MGQISGSKIRSRRIELGLSLREAAERAGVAASTFYKWENGTIGSMRVDKMKRLAQALALKESDLVAFEPAEKATITAPAWYSMPGVAMEKALEIFEDADARILLDAKRSLSREELLAVTTIIKSMIAHK